MSFLHKILPFLMLGVLFNLQAQQTELIQQLQDVGLKTVDAMALEKHIMDFERTFENSGMLSIINEENIYFDVFQCHQANQLLDKYEPVKTKLQQTGFTEKQLLDAKIMHFQRVHKYVQKTENRLQDTETYRMKELDERIQKYKTEFPEQLAFWSAYQTAVDESVKLSSRNYYKSKDDKAFVAKARILLQTYHADKANIDTMLDSITEGRHGKAIKIQLIGWKNDQRIKGSAGK